MESLQSTGPSFVRSPTFDSIALPSINDLPGMGAVANSGPSFANNTQAQSTTVPASSVAATTAPVVVKTTKVSTIKTFFKEPKKRYLILGIGILVLLGVGLFVLHRLYQKRIKRSNLDEEAVNELKAGQQERPPPPPTTSQHSGYDPVSRPPPPMHSQPFDPGQNVDHVGSASMRDQQRRMQDVMFREHQMRQQQGGMGSGDPSFRGGYPGGQPSGGQIITPGVLPNLGMDPVGGGSGAPLDNYPGSPADLGYDPI